MTSVEPCVPLIYECVLADDRTVIGAMDGVYGLSIGLRTRIGKMVRTSYCERQFAERLVRPWVVVWREGVAHSAFNYHCGPSMDNHSMPCTPPGGWMRRLVWRVPSFIIPGCSVEIWILRIKQFTIGWRMRWNESMSGEVRWTKWISTTMTQYRTSLATITAHVMTDWRTTDSYVASFSIELYTWRELQPCSTKHKLLLNRNNSCDFCV